MTGRKAMYWILAVPYVKLNIPLGGLCGRNKCIMLCTDSKKDAEVLSHYYSGGYIS